MLYKWYWFYRRILKTIRMYFFYSHCFNKIGKNVFIGDALTCTNPKNIEIGDFVRIGPYCRIESFVNYANKKTKGKIVISNGVQLEHGVHIYAAEEVCLGKNVLIASYCCITDENHGMDPLGKSYLLQPLESKKIVIDDEVWLGERVTVLPGSYIGKRSIIGANSVVIGTIPSYSIAAGIPAKVLKVWDFEQNRWKKYI